MSFYILLYLFVIVLLLYVWSIFYSKYKNLWWLWLFWFAFFISCWFLFYFLSYFWSTDISIMINISRLTYASSLLAFYSLILFILYFNSNNKKYRVNYIIKFLIWFIFLFSLLIIFTPLVIEWMYFNVDKNDYYEKTWLFFDLYLYLETFFVPLFIFLIVKKYKSLYYINKIRLKYILFWVLFFVVLWIIFQLVLPVYWIYILEKEPVLFILPFLFMTWYSITRYHFIDISYRYKQIYTFLISIGLTLSVFYLIKEFSISLPDNFIDYWWIKKSFTYVDLVVGIIIFNIFYKIVYFILPWNSEYIRFISVLNSWKENIPFISNLDDLNIYLTKEANKKFAVKHFKLFLFSGDNLDNSIYKYFTSNLKNDVFINDIVFIEENKKNIDIENIKNSIDKNIYIVFPIFDNKKNLRWILEIWKKPFNENFYTEEIKIIKEFVKFLVWHVKYMEIYSEINYLNLNLDKEVDRKTMEYNNLINRQKEFISMASHEIKTPVTASYMQIESIIDDVNSWEYTELYLKDELNILQEQISKVADLVKNIFTAQQYDIKDIWLYIEKVKLKNIVIWEYDILQRIYPLIDFQIEIPESIGFIELDKIQFIQVISNLLNNAIKFLDNDNPIIRIKSKSLLKNIELTIEDNWPGFHNWAEKIIFEKYVTWKWKSVWIGMWLYLCKKIVELHWWKIVAKKSVDLWWAKFKILIPKMQAVLS